MTTGPSIVVQPTVPLPPEPGSEPLVPPESTTSPHYDPPPTSTDTPFQEPQIGPLTPRPAMPTPAPISRLGKVKWRALVLEQYMSLAADAEAKNVLIRAVGRQLTWMTPVVNVVASAGPGFVENRQEGATPRDTFLDAATDLVGIPMSPLIGAGITAAVTGLGPDASDIGIGAVSPLLGSIVYDLRIAPQVRHQIDAALCKVGL